MDLILGVVADAANKAEGDKLNVLGIFHDLAARRLPCVHPRMALALSFRAKPYEKGKTFQVRIPLLDPDGKILFQINADLEILPQNATLEPVAPLAINLHNVALPKVGAYRFEVFVNDNRKGEIKFNLSLLKEQGDTDGSA